MSPWVLCLIVALHTTACVVVAYSLGYDRGWQARADAVRDALFKGFADALFGESRDS